MTKRDNAHKGLNLKFLNLITNNISDEKIIWCVGCPLHYSVFSRISGHHPLDDSSTPPPQLWQLKVCLDIAKVPWHNSWLRTQCLANVDISHYYYWSLEPSCSDGLWPLSVSCQWHLLRVTPDPSFLCISRTLIQDIWNNGTVRSLTMLKNGSSMTYWTANWG